MENHLLPFPVPGPGRCASNVACHCYLQSSQGMLLYFGPEVLMPVVSAVAAALGAILIAGKRVLDLFGSAFRRIGNVFGGSTVGETEEAGTDADRAADGASPGAGPDGGTKEDR